MAGNTGRVRRLLVSLVAAGALAPPVGWISVASATPSPDPDANGDVHSNCHTGSKMRGAGGADNGPGNPRTRATRTIALLLRSRPLHPRPRRLHLRPRRLHLRARRLHRQGPLPLRQPRRSKLRLESPGSSTRHRSKSERRRGRLAGRPLPQLAA
jgi:hypothetical protein